MRRMIGSRPNYMAPSTELAAVLANDGQQFGGVSSAPVSWRDKAKDRARGMFGARNASKLMTLMDVLPGIGDAAAVADAASGWARGERLMPAATLAMAALPLPMSRGMIGAGRIRPGAALNIDPRFETRKRELPRAANLEVTLRSRPSNAPKPKDVSIFDLEGQPFITSMSDLSAAGDDIVAINDVTLRNPVSRLGGQDYMFDRAGAVWAADKSNARKHLEMAQYLKKATGKDPLFMPWAMGPGAIDFAHMPRETMLQYAASAMNAKERANLEGALQSVLPDFKSLHDDASIDLFRKAVGKKRGELNKILDGFRDRGGIGLGEARLATTDLDQVGTQLTSLRNVGRIASSDRLGASLHPSYNVSVPGEGIGRLKENVGALELLPGLMQEANLTDPFSFPVGVVQGVKSPLRALQMSPKGGVITEKMLRAMQDRRANMMD